MKNKCYLPKSYDEVKALSDKALQAYWEVFYQYDIRGRNGKYRPLWYAIQCELRRCKLPEKYITRLNRYASDPGRYVQSANKHKYSLTVGTLLTKKYKDKIYQVVVRGDKSFEYEGELYPNLSIIACKITRSHVSGPAFFGLVGKQNVKN